MPKHHTSAISVYLASSLVMSEIFDLEYSCVLSGGRFQGSKTKLDSSIAYCLLK